MNIILCGLPKVGKTMLGKKLAASLNYNFIDLDHIIENRYAKENLKNFTCREIYTFHGEKKFRELEKLAIASLERIKNSVIALGGGSFEEKDNIPTLQAIGFIIYVKASFETLLARFDRSNIPAYLNEKEIDTSFRMIYQKRLIAFETYSDACVDTSNSSSDECLQLIVKHINLSDSSTRHV